MLSKDNKKPSMIAVLKAISIMLLFITLSSCSSNSKDTFNENFLEFIDSVFSDPEFSNKTAYFDSSANYYLWTATLDVLHKVSLSIIDSKNRIIQTEWIITKPFISDRYKIKVEIDKQLSSHSLKLDIIHQSKISNAWVNISNVNYIHNNLRELIFDRARILLISSQYN